MTQDLYETLPVDADQYAQQLYERGYVVIPVLDCPVGQQVRDDLYRDYLTRMPEYRTMTEAEAMATPLSAGGFSTLEHPSSFHNPWARKVRRSLHPVYQQVLGALAANHYPGEGLDYIWQVTDRTMHRVKGKQATAESWHRDLPMVPRRPQGDVRHTFGGWLNTNSDGSDQYFHCVPGTHRDPLTGAGFATFTKEQAKKLGFADQMVAVPVPKDHLLIFFETQVHEVVSTPAKSVQNRLFAGAVLSNLPMPKDERDALLKRIERLEVMNLKSGQEPEILPKMYINLHAKNRGKIAALAAQVRPECLQDLTLHCTKPAENAEDGSEPRVGQKRKKREPDGSITHRVPRHENVRVAVVDDTGKKRTKTYRRWLALSRLGVFYDPQEYTYSDLDKAILTTPA